MSFDANAHRASSLAGWEEAAPGWVRRQDAIRALGAPVSRWMLDAVVAEAGRAGARAGGGPRRDGHARGRAASRPPAG